MLTAEVIQARMAELNLKNISLAHACGVSERTVSRWRTGQNCISERHLKSVLHFLKLDPNVIHAPKAHIRHHSFNIHGISIMPNTKHVPHLNGIPLCAHHQELLRQLRQLHPLIRIKALASAMNEALYLYHKYTQDEPPILDKQLLDEYEIQFILFLRSLPTLKEIRIINKLLIDFIQ